MDYPVSKPRDHSPWDFGMLCDKHLRHLPSGLAEYFKIADNCVYGHLGIDQLRLDTLPE